MREEEEDDNKIYIKKSCLKKLFSTSTYLNDPLAHNPHLKQCFKCCVWDSLWNRISVTRRRGKFNSLLNILISGFSCLLENSSSTSVDFWRLCGDSNWSLGKNNHGLLKEGCGWVPVLYIHLSTHLAAYAWSCFHS